MSIICADLQDIVRAFLLWFQHLHARVVAVNPHVIGILPLGICTISRFLAETTRPGNPGGTVFSFGGFTLIFMVMMVLVVALVRVMVVLAVMMAVRLVMVVPVVPPMLALTKMAVVVRMPMLVMMAMLAMLVMMAMLAVTLFVSTMVVAMVVPAMFLTHVLLFGSASGTLLECGCIDIHPLRILHEALAVASTAWVVR